MYQHKAVSAFAALGHETRLAVFRLLIQAGEQGISAGVIAERAGILQNTLSAQLKILVQAELVTAERDGRTIIYRADMNGLGSLLSFVMEDCCNGQPDLCRPVVETLTCCKLDPTEKT